MVRAGLFAAMLLATTACSPKVEAPREAEVCWYVAFKDSGPPKFHKVSEKKPTLEQCAADLERMRLDFLRLGGGNDEIVGAYQGWFLFLKKDGIYTSRTLEGPRYLLLVRLRGKLVIPGAIVVSDQPR